MKKTILRSFGGVLAAADSTVSVVIKSYTRLNEESVKNGLSFWSLADNETYKYAAPVRKSQLSATALDYSVNVTSSFVTTRNVTTTIEFQVNTASVETSAIALLIDATKIKDLSGNFVFNDDDNEKAGEETDCIVKYITVSYKADGTTATTALNHSSYYLENFSPKLPYSALSIDSSSSSWVEDSSGKKTGAYKFVTYYADWSDYSSGTYETKYASDLASYLNKMYSVQYKEAGSSEWKADSAASFAYDSTEKLTDGTTANPTYRHYVATTTAYSYGTQFRLVTKRLAKSDAPSESASSKVLYGHDAYGSYFNKARTTYGAAKTVDFLTYTSSPEYILSVSDAFSADEFYSDDFEDAQRGILSVESVTDTSWTVELDTDGTSDNNQLEFGSTDGFLVLDQSGNKLESTVTSINSSTVLITLKNKAFVGQANIYVGSGTTLKQNYVNASQVKFGYPTLGDKNDLSDGYTKVDSFVMNALVVEDTTSSSDIDDYTVTYVSYADSTVQFFPVYLEAGKSYKVEIASGLSANTVNLENNGYSPAGKAYYVRLYNPSKSSSLNYGYAYGTNGYNYTGFTAYSSIVSESGIYYVAVERYRSYSSYSSYDGYVGFHVYEY